MIEVMGEWFPPEVSMREKLEHQYCEKAEML